MIDYKTAKSHGAKLVDRGNTPPEYFDEAIMIPDSPPEPMLLLLPHMIHGFNMLTKKWGTCAPTPSRIWPSDANFYL